MSNITGDHNYLDPNFLPWAEEVDAKILELEGVVSSGLLSPSVVDAKGDLLVATDDNTIVRKGIGAVGQPLRANPAATDGLTYGSMYLSGLHADMPPASATLSETQYFKTDRKEMHQSDGSNWNLLYEVGSTHLLVSTGGQFALSRSANAFDNIQTTSGVLKLTYFRAQRTETISEVRAWVGAVAAGATPTRAQYAVWEATEDGALVAMVGSTPNDTALFSAPNQSAKTKSLSVSYQQIKERYYAVGLLVVTAAAVPQFGGTFVGVDSESGDADRWCGQIAGLTTLPATASAGTVSDASSAIQFQLI